MPTSALTPRAAPTVLHYVQSWLEPSEQFVHGVVARSRHPAAVAASRAVANLERFPAPSLTRLGWISRLPVESLRRRVRTAALLRVADKHEVGLVHVHFGYRLPEVTGLVSRRRLPLVVSLHGHDVLAWDELRPGHYEEMVPHVARWIVPSRWMAGVVSRFGIDASAIEVVPAGVDTSLFRPSPVPAAPVVVFVGRFVAKKGIEVLIRAWPGVRAAVPDAQLRLCGYGPDRPAVLPAGVIVVDRPDRGMVAQQVADARVVVSPSITAPDGDSDTLLVVNLEAQAAGRPVVTTRHGGIPEYVAEGQTALLVDEGDAESLADALVSVLRDDDLARRLGAAGPQHVAPWDVARCVERIDQIYDALLGG